MVKFLPDGEAEVAERNGLAVSDEERVTRGGGGGGVVKKVADGEDVGIGGVADVDVILEVVAGAEDEGGFALCD